jgi:hypothetical protein
MRGQIQYTSPIIIPAYDVKEQDRKFNAMMTNLVTNTHITQTRTYAFGRYVNTTTHIH